MKKVTLNVHTRQISEPGVVKPTSPIWAFVNTGKSRLVINQNYNLLPGESFGVSVEGLVGFFLKDGIIVESATEFFLDFELASSLDRVKTAGLGHLIETFIEYK